MHRIAGASIVSVTQSTLAAIDAIRLAGGLEIGSIASDSRVPGMRSNQNPGTRLARFMAILAMGRAGIEPATLGLKVPCSTN